MENTKDTKDKTYINTENHSISMKIGVCPRCNKSKKIRDKAKYFYCCNAKVPYIDGTKTKVEGSEAQNNTVAQPPINSQVSDQGNMQTSQGAYNGSIEAKKEIFSLPVEAEKTLVIEDETPEEDTEQESDYKYQCSECRAMFNELEEGNTCPNPNCRAVLKID